MICTMGVCLKVEWESDRGSMAEVGSMDIADFENFGGKKSMTVTWNSKMKDK